MSTSQEQDAFDRGNAAGRLAARLEAHDKHFAAINGSVERMALNSEKVYGELQKLGLAVQRLNDQAIARDATVITTAAALKEAEQARRDKVEVSWSPVAKLFAGIAAISALVFIYFALMGR